MDLVGDLLARDRRTRETALVTADGRERTYHDLITNGYKAANVLRYLGVRTGATVAVDPTPGFHTTLAFLGAAAVGAPVRFDPEVGIEAGDRVVLAPVATAAALDPAPGTNLAAFGGPPERPETTHWEQELWSENPGMPPSDVEPDDDAVVVESGRRVSHHDLCSMAAVAVEAGAMDDETRVVLRRPSSDAPALAAGVVAPLSVGAAAVLAPPSRDGEPGDEPRGDVAVAPAGVDVPEPRRVDPASIGPAIE